MFHGSTFGKVEGPRSEQAGNFDDVRLELPAAKSLAQASSRAQALLEIDSVIKVELFSDMSAEDKAEVSFTWGLGALPRFSEFGGMRLELEEYQELPSSTLRHAGVSPTPPPVPMPTAPSEREIAA